MKRFLLATSFTISLIVLAAAQQIKVSPDNVTAYSQGATSVFLTYGGVTNKRPVEGCWCGEIVPAAPDLGFKCDQTTIFGCLPTRYNQSTLSGASAYTDIMSIPASVARRAYVDASRGNTATFFYVRRFANTGGGPDEYVPLTIRLGGNGAAVPFSLTGVKLSWGVDKPILFVKAGEKLPQPTAEITYTGTGRLKGRWELVKPGDELPSDRDLLTEATLPIEERGRQRRYTELSRFNTYLQPTGRITLPGPEVWRMQSKLEGMYLILLRIESVDDGLADSRLGDVGAGPAVVHSGGVAGFALPTLRYFIGASGTVVVPGSKNTLALLLPAENAFLRSNAPIDFTWSEVEGAAYYRLELEDAPGEVLLSAVVLQGATFYRAPPWIAEKARAKAASAAEITWRVTAFDERGKVLVETSRRLLRISLQKM